MEKINFEKEMIRRKEFDRILKKGISKKDIVVSKKDTKIAIIAVTEKGKITAENIKNGLKSRECDLSKEDSIKKVDIFFKRRGIKELTGEIFGIYDCIIFVSACGIAVRCIAPFLKSKFEDPAVLVVDDNGNNVISLLSGHIGGANDITLKVSEVLKANSVITTSTDTNKKGALDIIASKIGGYIEDFRESAKMVNSYLVENKKIGIYFDSDYKKEKENLNLSGFEVIEDFGIDEKDSTDLQSHHCKNIDSFELKKEKLLKYDVIVSVTDKLECDIDKLIKQIEFNQTCIIENTEIESYKTQNKECTERNGSIEQNGIKYIKLVPRRIVLGMGCRKNTETENMIKEFENFSVINNIHPAAISNTGSLIIKKDEKCMNELSDILCADFKVFTVEEISTCDYMFDKSEFVKKNTGVYSVAQPSAYLMSGDVFSKKYKNNGTTFAFGRKER